MRKAFTWARSDSEWKVRLDFFWCMEAAERENTGEHREELEESVENVERICEAVERCGLEADPQEIYDEMQKTTTVQ